MNRSILVPITGSQESLYAIELAWSLADRSNVRVDAQHVVDVRGALEFVGLENPGLIGRGPYLAAYEKVCAALRDVSRRIESAYAEKRKERAVPGELFIDEGEPLEEICRRLAEHDLAIIGHRRRATTHWPGGQMVRLSLAEKLASYSASPVLIVEKPSMQFSEVAAFVSMDHVNAVWLQNCQETARSMGARMSVTFFASGKHEQVASDFVADLKRVHPELADVNMCVVARSDGRPAQLARQHLWGTSGQPGVLCVIPTLDAGQERITTWGDAPSALLRRLPFEAVLIWPEECKQPVLALERVSSVAI